jgi:hypothetical protein
MSICDSPRLICRVIANFKQQKKKKAHFEAKADPEKGIWPSISFSKKLMHSKGD